MMVIEVHLRRGDGVTRRFYNGLSHLCSGSTQQLSSMSNSSSGRLSALFDCLYNNRGAYQRIGESGAVLPGVGCKSAYSSRTPTEAADLPQLFLIPGNYPR